MMMTMKLRLRSCSQRAAGGSTDGECSDNNSEEAPLVHDGKKSRNWFSPTLVRSFLFLCIASIILPLPRLIQRSIANVSPASQRSVPIPTIEDLRRMAASASIILLQQTSGSPEVDIGPLCDVIDISIEAVGVRGLLREVFETQSFRHEVVSAARKYHVLPGLDTEFGEHHMNVFYSGLINDPPTGGNRAHCTGCLWWIRHYVGAAIADRLLRTGSLSLDGRGDHGQRITDAKSFMRELQDLQRLPDSDFVTISTEHAFAWHTLAALRPGLPDGYPTDLLEEWCGDYVHAGIWQENLDTDLGRECRHAFGHAVFYAVMRGSRINISDKEHYSARTQFRPHMYDTPKELFEKMKQICEDAPINDVSRNECYGGINHSRDLLQKTDPPVLGMGGEIEGPSENFLTIDMYKKNRPLRVAMMGSGIYAKMAHQPILSDNPEVFDTKAIWSRHIEGAASLVSDFQEAFPQRSCTAYSGKDGLQSLLIRDDIDAIVMSLPLDVQPEYVIRALAAGKHVLSEKPTAGTTMEGLEVIKTYRETFRPKGLIWAVAEDSRYDALYAETARAVRDTIGPLKTLDFATQMVIGPDSDWLKTEWRAKSSWGDLGFFIDRVVHHVSGLRLIATGSPVSVRANFTSNLDYMPGYDSLHAIVEYADGASGTFEASYTNSSGGGENIHASDGANGKVVAIHGQGITDGTGSWKEVWEWGNKAEVFMSFAKDCKQVEEKGIDMGKDDENIIPEQSLRDVAFLEACLESSLAGGERREIKAFA